jgi:hypothetical protein
MSNLLIVKKILLQFLPYLYLHIAFSANVNRDLVCARTVMIVVSFAAAPVIDNGGLQQNIYRFANAAGAINENLPLTSCRDC